MSRDLPLQGLFARRRQLLLTEGPHLYYVDPVNKVLKGEIPWSLELRPEAKNFKTFFVHTVNNSFCCPSSMFSSSGMLRLAYWLDVPFMLWNLTFFFCCSLTEHTIWWTPAEMLTDGARRSMKCGERSIKSTKTLAYRSTVPLVATPLLALRPITEQSNTLFSALHHRNLNKLLETLASRPCLFSWVEPWEKYNFGFRVALLVLCALCEASIAFFHVWMIRLPPCTSAFCTFCRGGREVQACPVEWHKLGYC